MNSTEIQALRGVTGAIPTGTFTFLLGPSGSGKSTLLHLIGALDEPTSGEILVAGRKLGSLSAVERDEYRRNDVGFIFQSFNLLKNLSALDNVLVPFMPEGVSAAKRKEAEELLARVGLGDRLDHSPSQLSGGEQQRVAIARALAKNPKLLLCDEPTGALDYNTGKAILKLLQDTARAAKMTVVVITHNLAIAPMGDRLIQIKNGLIESVRVNENPLPVERIEW